MTEPTQQEILARLVSEGWTPATEPPDTDRVVQVAWDDGSTGPTSLAFYDSVMSDPPRPQKYWWGYPEITQYFNPDAIIAWRECRQKEK